jgi:prepilin-type N-terminal cleavage/methylation domain-containing protein
LSPSEAQREHGFTLIEVLAAVLIVCLVFGLLLESVTHNLRDLSVARQDARAAQVAEDQVHEFELLVETGEKIEDGVREEPCVAAEDLICQTIIAPTKLALPADYPGELTPSPLFAGPNEPPLNPGQDPPLRLVQVRAYPPETDPNTVEPYVVLLVAPLDSQTLQQLQQLEGEQQLQQQQQQTGGEETGQGGSGRSNQPRGRSPSNRRAGTAR